MINQDESIKIKKDKCINNDINKQQLVKTNVLDDMTN